MELSGMTSNGEVEAAEQPRGDHDLVRQLPDDVLADVLGRLAPRWLAASRCVCKTWHAVVDACGLLHTDLVPLSLHGIIIQFRSLVYWEYFSRPTTRKGHSIGKYSLTADSWVQAIDHCNGLLLLRDRNCTHGTRSEYVANPATGWSAPLPPCPAPCLATEGDYYRNYLVFDPSMSEHYEVFSIPRHQIKRSKSGVLLDKLEEWPPSIFITRVFSSVSQTWEERSFSIEGEHPGPTTIIRSFLGEPCAVYRRGSVYIRCENDIVMRLSSSKSKFRVIEPPVGIQEEHFQFQELHLGKSEKGVYFASLYNFGLRVWILDESCGHMKWILTHDNNLRPMLPTRENNPDPHGSWILQDINYRSGIDVDDPEEPLSGHKFTCNSVSPDEKFEWNSDSDDALEDKDMINMGYLQDITILGFHPYKEIVFFSRSMETGLAYYLNTSKVQVLGNLDPTNYDDFILLPHDKDITASFPYTPCLIEMCPRHN